MGLFTKPAGWSKPVAVKLTKAQAAKAAIEATAQQSKRQADIKKTVEQIRENLFSKKVGPKKV